MALTIGDTAPNFRTQTTEGEIDSLQLTASDPLPCIRLVDAPGPA